MLSPARSRDRIADESEARSPARDVYPVAKETSTTERHADMPQIPEGILKSFKGWGILVSNLPNTLDH